LFRNRFIFVNRILIQSKAFTLKLSSNLLTFFKVFTKMDLNDRFGEALKYFKKSQKDFAEHSGYSKQYVNSIINGKDSIGLTPIKKILDLLPDLDANWLLRGEGEITKQQSTLGEPQPEYGNTDKDLRQALEDCRKDKERAWAEVEWLRGQIDEIKKKEAS
jgi:transcriptional regulator with XRE-family HTH domain